MQMPQTATPAQQARPMTYLFSGKRYIVVAVGSTNHPAELWR
jgi:hypothetical protein